MITLLLWSRYLVLALIGGVAASLFWIERSRERKR